MMENYRNIILLFSALLTPTLAAAAIILTILNYKLSKRKRQDELFDRRYKFYKDFERLWKTTGPESEGATRMHLEWDDILPFAQEASWLFGSDIVKHLNSYENKSFTGIKWVPDTELAKPFNKYLRF